MTKATPVPTHTDRTGVILGDRVCVRCGFNLYGQPIVREPHYSMLSVRCPECSTLAALQEYPVVGRWAGRVGLLLALAWIGAALLAAFLTGLTLVGFSRATSELACRPVARDIGLAFAAYAREHASSDATNSLYHPDNLSNYVTRADAEHTWIDVAWVNKQDLGSLASDTRYSPRALLATVPMVLAAAGWGSLWSVLLLHLRRSRRLILLAIFLSVTGGILATVYMGGADNYSGWWGVSALQFATARFGLPIALIALGIGAIGLALGLLFGRSAARLAVRILLPSHLRGPFAALWHADALPSPSTRRDFWLRG